EQTVCRNIPAAYELSNQWVGQQADNRDVGMETGRARERVSLTSAGSRGGRFYRGCRRERGGHPERRRRWSRRRSGLGGGRFLVCWRHPRAAESCRNRG